MPLNSWQFVLLATTAVLFVPFVHGTLRVAAFLFLNAIFAWSLWGAGGIPVALTYCLAGYGSALVVRGRGTPWLVAVVAALTAAFVYLAGYQMGGRTGGSIDGIASVTAFAGLSFMFFKIVHVVVDSAAGSMEHLSLGHYLNYCLSFTTVLMGPIQRYQDFVAQWQNPSRSTFESNLDATNRVLRGFFKAFVFAPLIHPFVLQRGIDVGSYTTGELWLAVYGFYVYLYLDFSGYCDIMIGIGRLMGFTLPENFNFPFLSRNVSEYWLRVHRTLTQWLTDYVFTPSYHAALRHRLLGAYPYLTLAASLVMTMVIAGLWHGTTWNFIVFGFVHGIALAAVQGYELCLVRVVGRKRFRQFEQSTSVRATATFVTYNFTSLAYVAFALDLGQARLAFEILTASALAAI